MEVGREGVDRDRREMEGMGLFLGVSYFRLLFFYSVKVDCLERG